MSGVVSYLYEVFLIQHLILGVRERFKKRRQLISGSKQSLKFDRILMKIGGEPYWIRSKSGGSMSAPLLTQFNNNNINNNNNHIEPIAATPDHTQLSAEESYIERTDSNSPHLIRVVVNEEDPNDNETIVFNLDGSISVNHRS
uniref:Uncharacterized protein n=1 Tax=Ditylenchus dipsaci TaxID=166011 RepID=A0A915DCK5_9BILA